MRTADPTAPVPHQHDYRELGPRQLHSGGVGDGPAVQAVEGARREVAIGESDAADVSYDHHLARVELKPHERLIQALEQGRVPAARAEGKRA